MNQLWTIYHPEIPPFLQEFAQTPPMQRLKQVGMNCGCEYTGFPRFVEIGPYSRFDHSLGVALIVWHFTGSIQQTLAGLFHDVTTPVFAHVVDFLNGDHLRQESTEAGVAECLAASPEIVALLKTGLPCRHLPIFCGLAWSGMCSRPGTYKQRNRRSLPSWSQTETVKNCGIAFAHTPVFYGKRHHPLRDIGSLLMRKSGGSIRCTCS